MWSQITILGLQLVLKCLPILYQFKILKDEATLKEMQRRYEEAIRKAEADALDSVRLKDQHDANRRDLEDMRKKAWGNTPVPVPAPTPNPAPVPTPVKVPRIEAPDKVDASENFRIELIDMPENEGGLTLYADQWKLQDLGTRRVVLMSLMASGDRTLYVKIGERIIAQRPIEIISRD
jgi:hypothetical protein